MIQLTKQSQIRAILISTASKILEAIAKEVESLLRENTQTLWYDSHEHEFYNRTMEFLNSITSSKVETEGEFLKIRIFFDAEKMNSLVLNDKSVFNSRANVSKKWGEQTKWEGIPLAELLVEFIEEGQKSKIHPYDGVHMIAKTRDDIQRENLIQKVAQMFGAFGIGISMKG